MYFISDATRRKSAPLMSAFPRETRPFTEPISASTDATLGAGLTMTDLIRAYYPGASISAFNGKFGFLDRDNKERTYDPGQTDPFVFRNLSSLTMFRDEALKLIQILCDEWSALGLPLIDDEDRKIRIPDTSYVWNSLSPDFIDSDRGRLVIKHMKDIQFIVSNVDIMKKACIVRTVSAGWWAVSYAGKTTANLGFFRASLDAHKAAFDLFIASPAGRSSIKKYWDEYGDPLFSNCGYPFFSAEVDKMGNPISKIKVIQLYKGIGSKHTKWSDVLAEIDYRSGKFGMPGFPLAVAGLRRLQAGRKWIHQFTITPSGMRTAYDEKGINSIRVAWMVPYIYNVLLSPISTIYKAWRMSLPGCNHSGDIKRERAACQRDAASKGQLWLAEADYSNYDRFIPVDIIRSLVQHVCGHTDRPDYWEDASMYLFDDANLVWPDFSSVVDGNGILFRPGRLGLMSGVKTTGDMGSLVNSVVNLAALALVKGWNHSQMLAYLTQYHNAPVGSLYEYYNVQSDDTLIIDKSPKDLFMRGEAFNRVAKVAGLKGSVELGDRFLMRHYTDGGDLPVPARVWQNTLSNETPPLSETIFLAGLASRTDGLFGGKTVDPFNTSPIQSISPVAAKFSKAVTDSLSRFITKEASIKSRLGSEFLNLVSSVTINPSTPFRLDGSLKVRLDDWRKGIGRILAREQLSVALASSSPESITAWLYELYKDRHVPSASLILDELIELDPSLQHQIDALAAKECAFFRYAIGEVGIRPIPLKG